MKRSPLLRVAPMKKRRTKRRVHHDPKYLAWVRTLPCVVCFIGWISSELAEAIFETAREYPNVLSEAAHVGEGAGMGQKCPDRESLPMCGIHHQHGKDAHHVLGKGFWKHHKLDRKELVSMLGKRYDGISR